MEFGYTFPGESPQSQQFWQPPSPPPPPLSENRREPGFLNDDYSSQGIGYTNEYYGQGIGRANENFQIFNNVHQENQRELEKQRIRDEIIAEEIARRRVLEAEVREELRMERDMASRMRGSGNAFDRFLAPVAMEPGRRLPSLQETQGLSLEERIAICVEEMLKLRERSEGHGCDKVPFQGRGEDSKFKKATPSHSENGNQKEKIIFLAKPSAPLSGTKKKVALPAKESENKHFGVGSKTDWSCVICKVSSTSERDLKNHFRGNKHKSKEAALRAERTGSNIGLGVLGEKRVLGEKPSLVVTHVSSHPQTPKAGGKAPRINQCRPSLPHIDPTKCLDERSVSKLAANEKNDKSKKKKFVASKSKEMFTFWCNICQVGADDERAMIGHSKGKKHLNLLQKTMETDQASLTTQIDETTKKESEKKKPFVVKYWKVKKDWSCVICQLTTKSEHDLKKHFQGKKHKSMEDALKAERNGSNIENGVLPKKTENPTIQEEGKGLQINQSEPSKLHIVSTRCLDEKSVSVLPEEKEEKDKLKSGNDKKEDKKDYEAAVGGDDPFSWKKHLTNVLFGKGT